MAHRTQTHVGIVKVTDGGGGSAEATLTVNAPLVPASATLTVDPGSNQVLAVAGGEAPYVFSIVSGAGTIDASSGQYTAPSTGGSATVKITDALGTERERGMQLVRDRWARLWQALG